MAQHALLQARGLRRDFRGFQAVRGVDLDVDPGSVHALVGPNGAGKTTLFNLLTGFLTPSGGSVRIGDTETTRMRPDQIAALGVGRSFQINSLFEQLTCRAHLEIALQARTSVGYRFWRGEGLTRRFRAAAEELLEQVGLADQARVPASELAYGQKRALELALVFAGDPKLMLLDEPTAGMGVEDVDRTVELVQRIRQDRTIVLIEHNMTVVGDLADTVTVLQRGEVLVEGDYATVQKDPRVIEAYLGGGHAEGA